MTKKPSVRNPERTKANLLRSGVELFSKHGYDGVAVDEIVKRAGCNKRMLYHYYGSKDGLYIEVLRQVFHRFENLENSLFDPHTTLSAAIEKILQKFFEFLRENPEFVNLLLWENLNKGRFLNSHPGLLSKTLVLKQLSKVLQAARDRGEITRKIDASQLLLLLYGACFIYHSNRYTLQHTLGLEHDLPKVTDRAQSFIHRVITDGITD